MTLYFKQEHETVKKAADAVADSAVSIHEMTSENVLGDPHLGPAMRTATAAVGALDAALALLALSLEQIESAEAAEVRG